MPITLDWPEVALRLALAVLGGTVLGINRSERGMAAGLRTNLLVCLAAAVAMIQVNLLLSLRGRAPDSFVMNDLMRLPLGILTGVGFIGGGAILRRGDSVTGVTTAATLWFATVLGLCFGGGQHGLGLAALAIGVVVLWLLKRLEVWMKQEHRATLMLTAAQGAPSDDEIRGKLAAAGFSIASWDETCQRKGDSSRRTIRAEVRWRSRGTDAKTPEVVRQLAEHHGVIWLRWKA